MAKSLNEQIDALFKRRGMASRDGLKLLDEAFRQIGEHKNADPFLRFIGYIQKDAPMRARVSRMMRIAFGEHLKVTIKAGKFSVQWINWPDGGFNLDTSNTYSVVREAVSSNKGWDDPVLFKALKEYDPKPPAKPKAAIADQAALDKLAERMVGQIKERLGNGYTMGQVLAAMQAMVKAESTSLVTPIAVGMGHDHH